MYVPDATVAFVASFACSLINLISTIVTNWSGVICLLYYFETDVTQSIVTAFWWPPLFHELGYHNKLLNYPTLPITPTPQVVLFLKQQNKCLATIVLPGAGTSYQISGKQKRINRLLIAV